MGSHCSFGHLKHKLWPKEGSGVEFSGVEFPGVCQFCSRPLKVRNRPEILGCKERATYRWKGLDETYNFASDRVAIWGLLAKLWGSKVPGVPFGAISGLPLGSPGRNSHLDVASVESCRVYYKGEGGGFPQVRAVVSLVCPCCPWLVLAPRVFQLCTNHFVWVVCRSVWVTKACQLFLVPSRSSNPPLYPSKGCELRSVFRLLLIPLLSTWAHIWVPWRVGGASTYAPWLPKNVANMATKYIYEHPRKFPKMTSYHLSSKKLLWIYPYPSRQTTTLRKIVHWKSKMPTSRLLVCNVLLC